MYPTIVPYYSTRENPKCGARRAIGLISSDAKWSRLKHWSLNTWRSRCFLKSTCQTLVEKAMLIPLARRSLRKNNDGMCKLVSVGCSLKHNNCHEPVRAILTIRALFLNSNVCHSKFLKFLVFVSKICSTCIVDVAESVFLWKWMRSKPTSEIY